MHYAEYAVYWALPLFSGTGWDGTIPENATLFYGTGQNMYSTFSYEFCMVITLEHHRPAHEVLRILSRIVHGLASQ